MAGGVRAGIWPWLALAVLSLMARANRLRWLALAVRRNGFVLMPVRQGPPPGALLADDRLCGVLDLSR